MGEGKQVSAQQQGDGSYRIYIGLTVPEDFATSGAVDLSKAGGDAARSQFITNAEFFGTWGSDPKDFIANSEGAWKPWPLYHLPSDALCWSHVPGVTLVGDAAHLSTPFVGEGVNCSMYDSLALAGQIVERGLEQLDAAVEAYEKDMFQRGRDLIDRSNASAALIFAHDAPQPLLDVIAKK
jgi:2-polyprenyl-6-methoxyphenol hydroxylase-like FAD-dependent oxidoreductase